jgi:hypothetical protein
MKHTLLFPALAAATLALALACSDASGPGQLSVALSPSAPAPTAAADALPGVEAIWVNVTAVRAHSADAGWVTLDTAPVRVNLLAIAEAGIDLGLANVPSGRVTQLRLVVEETGNVVVMQGGAEVPLKVPSGSQSGIKIHGPWDVDACEETALTLELDGHRSIWAHGTGSGEEWNLRPVIRTVAVQGPGTCEPPATCVPAECASGACDASGDQCAPGGTATPCIEDAECLSNVCDEGACAPGEEGAPCRAPADCRDGFTCAEGSCAPVSVPL